MILLKAIMGFDSDGNYVDDSDELVDDPHADEDEASILVDSLPTNY